MKKLALVVCGCLLVPSLLAQKKKLGTPSAATLAHGKYLVENVAGCNDCHTPHDQKGEPIQAQYLQGTDLPFQPTVPMPGWAQKSPNIAGLPGWDKDAAIRFLMTGIAQNGLPPHPPMPQFKLNLQDATAVVAYLKSLKPKQ